MAVVGVVVGGGDVVGGLVGGGEVRWVAGVCETGGLDGVEVMGWVLVLVGAVVEVLDEPCTAEAGMPLFSTANHAPATACPFAWPFFVSPSKR